ncbi:DUF2243 domain-containing protein [Acuticoccus sp.]|uniref:DUF2243 domain-containing protein n=1 Tax=Acuticoccus sp. TaxID=1904378 RepID=UPI003B5166ED
MDERSPTEFPIAAGILLGLGVGGFFDGIVLHQILQWHHMASSAGYPPDTMANLRLNVVLDGLFHVAAYAFTLAGLVLLWRSARRPHGPWPARLLAGTVLAGFGLFNLVEGTVNHHLLGLHHVNETVPEDHWIYWDIAFLVWGAAMLVAGALLTRSGLRNASRLAQPPSTART